MIKFTTGYLVGVLVCALLGAWLIDTDAQMCASYRSAINQQWKLTEGLRLAKLEP